MNQAQAKTDLAYNSPYNPYQNVPKAVVAESIKYTESLVNTRNAELEELRRMNSNLENLVNRLLGTKEQKSQAPMPPNLKEDSIPAFDMFNLQSGWITDMHQRISHQIELLNQL